MRVFFLLRSFALWWNNNLLKDANAVYLEYIMLIRVPLSLSVCVNVIDRLAQKPFE